MKSYSFMNQRGVQEIVTKRKAIILHRCHEKRCNRVISIGEEYYEDKFQYDVIRRTSRYSGVNHRKFVNNAICETCWMGKRLSRD